MKSSYRISRLWLLPLGTGLIAAFALVFSSCQKVIQIDLNSASPKIVIEGVVTDSLGPYRVMITKSGSYFNQPFIPPVEGAFVTISDDQGIVDTLSEEQPGIYLTTKTQGIPGHSYFLKVIAENNEYLASTTMKTRVEIDSLFVQETQGPAGRKRRNVVCRFRDPAGEKNYYRVKFFDNGKTSKDNYRLYDDQYTDGELVDIRAGGATAGALDGVILMSIDKKAYDYFHTLEDIIRTNPFFGSTPANPNTNLSNGALGYFAAYTVTAGRIRVP